MSYLSKNLKFLRRGKGLTQQGLADKLDVKRANIGSYEEDRSEPRLNTVKKMCDFFKISIDDMINKDLTIISTDEMSIAKDERLRVLTIAVDKDDEELITLVPIKASAGYLDGYGDIEFIEELPNFSLPFPEISRGKTYRAFEIKGDSMLPIASGSYVLCEYVTDIKSLKSGNCYVLVSNQEGIIYKRVINELKQNQKLYLKSDNKNYDPYNIDGNDIREAWKAIGYLSFDLPEENTISIAELSDIVMDLREKIEDLKGK